MPPSWASARPPRFRHAQLDARLLSTGLRGAFPRFPHTAAPGIALPPGGRSRWVAVAWCVVGFGFLCWVWQVDRGFWLGSLRFGVFTCSKGGGLGGFFFVRGRVFLFWPLLGFSVRHS